MDEFPVGIEPRQSVQPPVDHAGPEAAISQQFEAMGQLLNDFESQQSIGSHRTDSEVQLHEDSIAKKRLGIASGLFFSPACEAFPLRIALAAQSLWGFRAGQLRWAWRIPISP